VSNFNGSGGIGLVETLHPCVFSGDISATNPWRWRCKTCDFGGWLFSEMHKHELHFAMAGESKR